MSRCLVHVVLGVALVIGRPAAAAAQPDSRLHAGVSLGFSKVWDDEGGIGTGMDVGASAGWLAGEHLDLSVALSTLAHDRPTSFLSWDGRLWMLSARAAYGPRARRARVWPFVAGGLGLMRSTGTITERALEGPFSPMPPEIVDVRSWSFTGPLWEVGGGAEIRFGRAFVRPEAWWTVGMLDRGERFGVPEPPISVTRIIVAAGVKF
jgi:hypothetical protein